MSMDDRSFWKNYSSRPRTYCKCTVCQDAITSLVLRVVDLEREVAELKKPRG